jgi:hypothetical protein
MFYLNWIRMVLRVTLMFSIKMCLRTRNARHRIDIDRAALEMPKRDFKVQVREQVAIGAD